MRLWRRLFRRSRLYRPVGLVLFSQAQEDRLRRSTSLELS